MPTASPELCPINPVSGWSRRAANPIRSGNGHCKSKTINQLYQLQSSGSWLLSLHHYHSQIRHCNASSASRSHLLKFEIHCLQLYAPVDVPNGVVRILLQGARARGARVPKFVVTESSRSESHLALCLQNVRAFANSRGGTCPSAPCLTTPLLNATVRSPYWWQEQ